MRIPNSLYEAARGDTLRVQVVQVSDAMSTAPTLRFRSLAWNRDLKDDAVGVSGLHIHASPVQLDDLLHNVKSKSEALVLPGLALPALEGLE